MRNISNILLALLLFSCTRLADRPQLASNETVGEWTFTESSADVVSPGRGFYSWNVNDADKGLALIRIVLVDYCGKEELDTAVLESVAARLESLRSSGKQAIIRVIYADDGKLNPCGLAEAARPDIALHHLQQLAPTFASHRQDIAFFEAGFYGMWGEWNSEYAPGGEGYAEDPELRFNLVRALLDQLPHDFLIMLRRPRFREEMAARMTGDDLKRLGFHNDCYLSTADDMGTYDGNKSPDQWKQYISELSQQGQAIGGETCVDDPVFTSCDAAMADMKRLGMTYLNTGWNPAVLQRWKNEGCYDEIAARLGYRFVLTAARAQRLESRNLEIAFKVKNDGFAPAYQKFEPKIQLVHESGQVFKRHPIRGEAIDPRLWRAGESFVGHLEVDTQNLPAGRYEIYLGWEYFDRILRFPLVDTWDKSRKSYRLGYINL